MNRLEQVQALFFHALDLPPDDRAHWLETHCTDASIREAAADLLNAHGRMSQAFRAYRAVAVLGRGGMSAFYRAERADRLRLAGIAWPRRSRGNFSDWQRKTEHGSLTGLRFHPDSATILLDDPF